LKIIKKFEHYDIYDRTEPSRWEKEKSEIDDILNIAKDICKVEIYTIVGNNRTNDKLLVNICRYDIYTKEVYCTDEEIKQATVNIIERLEALGLNVVERFSVRTINRFNRTYIKQADIKISEYDQENIERIKRSFDFEDIKPVISIEISNIRLTIN